MSQSENSEEQKDIDIHSDINIANCLNSNGAWNIDDNACDYRYNLNGNCEKRTGNWIYPSVCNK